MNWYHYLALAALGICIVSMVLHFLRLIRLGKPVDYAPPAGKIAPAVRYSFTGAMHPLKKESAFLHLPTYTAGVFYHLGTFLSLFLFFIFLGRFTIPGTLKFILAGFFMMTGGCGVGILVKRFFKKDLRRLSNPDDYLSNLLVTLFHLFSAIILFMPSFLPAYFVLAAIFFLYFPLGKLKHALYFFAARYHLGVFYGWRGVWPPEPM